MAFKFIHAADIHLDSPLRNLERYEGAPTEEIRGATRKSLENLVNLAESENVDFVLLAGDVYDGDWKDYNTGLHFAGQMSKLRDRGIRVLAISGNHDADSQITQKLKLPENVTFLSTSRPETQKLDDINVAVHGQGFPTAAVTKNLAKEYPIGDPSFFNIGLLHTCLSPAEAGAHQPYAPCSIGDLESKSYQYWALGHVHQRRIVSENPWIVFPGNIQGRHANECGEKGCYLVNVDGQGVARPEFRTLDVVRWARCSIATDKNQSSTADDICNQAQNEIERIVDEADGRIVAIRVEISGETEAHSEFSDDPERWRNQFRAASNGLGNVWLEKISFNTRRISDPAPLSSSIGMLLSSLHDSAQDDERITEAFSDKEIQSMLAQLPREAKDTAEESGSSMEAQCLEKAKATIEALLAPKNSNQT